MQIGNSNNSEDLLNLTEDKSFTALLNENQQIILSTYILKYNRHGKCEERILLVTDKAILNILKNSNILKVFIKKFVKVEDKYEIKRRIPLSQLYGITMTPNRNQNMFLLHVNKDHDYYYQAYNNKLMILKAIVNQFKKVTKKQLPFYFKDQLVLLNYCTYKNHLKEKKDLKPKEDPHYLNEDYFADKQFEDTEYFNQCLFETEQNMGIRPKNFKRIDLNLIKSDLTYFVLKEQFYKSIHLSLLPKNPGILKPWFLFFNQKKQMLFVPFMLGGCLKNYVSKHLPLPFQYLVFYLNQLINLLMKVEEQGWLYYNLSLDNIFVKRNGYLVLDGLQSMEQINRQQQPTLMRKISGNPYYFAPEVITFEGYHKELIVWKLGICCYYLFTGKFPFRGKNIKELYYQILNKPIEQSDVPQFVLKMLEKDKTKRITLGELKQLPVLKKTNWSDLSAEKIKAPLKVNIQNWTGKMPVIYELRMYDIESPRRSISI